MDTSLHEAFLDELADLYDAEKQLVRALPKMAKAAKSDQLKEAFEKHLVETEGHVDRLNQVVDSIGETLKSNDCEAMEGLVLEAEEMHRDFKEKEALDAVLIACAQKVEHYEIASYGTLIAWANQMGHTETAEILEATLTEEKAADGGLTEIAESMANRAANK